MPMPDRIIAGYYHWLRGWQRGVAAFNGDTDVLSYDQGLIRMGSDFDGVSDALEANVIFNNYPPELFPASDFPGPDGVNFFDELNKNATTTISLRGNVLVNNGKREEAVAEYREAARKSPRSEQARERLVH